MGPSDDAQDRHDDGNGGGDGEQHAVAVPADDGQGQTQQPVADPKPVVSQEQTATSAASQRHPSPLRRLSVAKLVRSFSPRARAKTEQVATKESTTSKHHHLTWGRIKRSSATTGDPPSSSVPGSSADTKSKAELKPTAIESETKPAKKTNETTQTTDKTSQHKAEAKSESESKSAPQPTAGTAEPRSAHNRSPHHTEVTDPDPAPAAPAVAGDASGPPAASGPAAGAEIRADATPAPTPVTPDAAGTKAYVDQVRATLDRVVAALDAVSRDKLGAIRMGGELRGLVGKAQDEMAAHADVLEAHALEVGVAIALHNLAAALEQVFPIAQRLTSARFLLNRQFKREVLFAFEEINSYYTSLFMEVSIAIAKHAGLVLPMPTPTPVTVPKAEDEEHDHEPEQCEPSPPPPPPPAEPPIPEISADELCLQAHQCFFGHGRAQDRAKAVDLYRQAAEHGSIVAMRCLGQAYRDGGLGVERDVFLADQWLGRATASGDIEAAYLLGTLLIEKATNEALDVTRQALTAQAKAHFVNAATQGHADAQYRLGCLLEMDQDPSSRDGGAIVEASHWFHRAAEQSHPRAAYRLGRLLLQADRDDGDPTSISSAIARDVPRAIHFLQFAAQHDDVEAIVRLGSMYATGEGGRVDRDRAMALWRRAVALHHPQAMFLLACLLLDVDRRSNSSVRPTSLSSADNSRLGLCEDSHDEAVGLLLAAGQAGIADAWHRLGELLEVSPWLQDRKTALRFYSRAALAPEPCIAAAKRAANMHYMGIGCEVDKQEAHRFFTIAARARDADALNALGLLHEDGEGCELDFARAAACFREAAQQDLAAAHFNLGCLFERGKGVPRDLAAAQAHFRRAFELGYTLAHEYEHSIATSAPTRSSATTTTATAAMR